MEQVTAARRSAGVLLDIINDVLDYSKMESGRLRLDQAEFCLRDGVGDVLESMESAAEIRGLEVICNLDPALPEYVTGDAVRLRQVLSNLVGNSIKFTECGEVVVSLSVKERVSSRVRISCEVADTGIGIAPSHM